MISDRTLIQGQENRFNSKDKKLVQSRTWPEIFSQKVDLNKIQLQVIRPWIEKKILEYIGMEDEITANLLITELESYKQYPCPKELSIMMTDVLRIDNILYGQLIFRIFNQLNNKFYERTMETTS